MTINIPDKINVGFQNRGSTYTGKLAYIIYFDNKGKLRKETSWENWRDKSIPNEIYDNEPTSGFVLNKKAGGYSTGWNHRQTYVRVYDPRGFEFEITVANLLYILENTNSIKGKGLEGDFVYGWDGKDLLLMPTDSPDYQSIYAVNKLIKENKSYKGKDMKIGARYLSKDQEELIYLGRFDYYTTEYGSYDDAFHTYRKYSKLNGKRYFFAKKGTYRDKEDYDFIVISTLSKNIIDTIDEECVDNYATLMDKLESSHLFNKIKEHKIELLDKDYVLKRFKSYSWGLEFAVLKDGEGDRVRETFKAEEREDGQTYIYSEVDNPKYRYHWTLNTEPRFLRIDYGTIDEFMEIKKPAKLVTYLESGAVYGG